MSIFLIAAYFLYQIHLHPSLWNVLHLPYIKEYTCLTFLSLPTHTPPIHSLSESLLQRWLYFFWKVFFLQLQFYVSLAILHHIHREIILRKKDQWRVLGGKSWQIWRFKLNWKLQAFLVNMREWYGEKSANIPCW